MNEPQPADRWLKGIDFNASPHDHTGGHVHGAHCSHGAAPIERDGPKVGRNDPCACGSGKKSKKCCGT